MSKGPPIGTWGLGNGYGSRQHVHVPGRQGTEGGKRGQAPQGRILLAQAPNVPSLPPHALPPIVQGCKPRQRARRRARESGRRRGRLDRSTDLAEAGGRRTRAPPDERRSISPRTGASRQPPCRISRLRPPAGAPHKRARQAGAPLETVQAPPLPPGVNPRPASPSPPGPQGTVRRAKPRRPARAPPKPRPSRRAERCFPNSKLTRQNRLSPKGRDPDPLKVRRPPAAEAIEATNSPRGANEHEDTKSHSPSPSASSQSAWTRLGSAHTLLFVPPPRAARPSPLICVLIACKKTFRPSSREFQASTTPLCNSVAHVSSPITQRDRGSSGLGARRNTRATKAASRAAHCSVSCAMWCQGATPSILVSVILQWIIPPAFSQRPVAPAQTSLTWVARLFEQGA